MVLYDISNITQSIDINDTSVNFRAYLSVKSENNTPFDAVVLSQTQQESDEPIEFKHIQNGVLETEVINQTKTHDYYFLLIKSDKPCKCDIQVEKEELPLTAKTQPTPTGGVGTSSNSSPNYIAIMIVVALVCVGVYVYMKDNEGTKFSLSDQKLFDRLNQLT